MNRKVWIVSLALIFGIGLAGAATYGWYQLFWLPPPSAASREQLFRWLALRDLHQEPQEVCLALIERFEAELANTAAPLPTARLEVPPKYQSRVEENAQLLLQLWFTSRAEQYGELPREQRAEFLGEKIRTLLAWSGIQQQLTGQASNSAASGLGAMLERIQDWSHGSPPAIQAAISQVLSDGLVYWLASDDLREQPPQLRRQLALRIAENLGDGSTRQTLAVDLNPAEQQQLRQNAVLLFQAWFYAQAETWAELASDEQPRFVDEQIERILSSGVLALISDSPSGAHGGVQQMNGLLEQWVREADPQQRPQVEQLVAQVRQRLLLRQMEQFWKILLPAAQ